MYSSTDSNKCDNFHYIVDTQDFNMHFMLLYQNIHIICVEENSNIQKFLTIFLDITIFFYTYYMNIMMNMKLIMIMMKIILIKDDIDKDNISLFCMMYITQAEIVF